MLGDSVSIVKELTPSLPLSPPLFPLTYSLVHAETTKNGKQFGHPTS